MKIHYRILAAFMTLAFLAGIVGLFSLNASRQIVRSFEGGDEYFQDVFQASTELAGLSKRMEGHFMLFLFLGDPLDRDKFFQINELLQDKISFLEKNIQNTEGIELLAEIKAGVFRHFLVGQTILGEYDRDMKSAGGYRLQDHEDLLRKFQTIGSIAVIENIARLASLETDFLNRQLAITTALDISRETKKTEGHLVFFLALQDHLDLQKYRLGNAALENAIVILKSHVQNDQEALKILANIQVEAQLFGLLGSRLLESYRLTVNQGNIFVPQDHAADLREFFGHSLQLRTLGMQLSKLMAGLEQGKKDRVIRAVTAIQRNIAVMVVGGGILSLIISFFLARYLARPIVRLKEAALEIGKGNMDAAADIRGEGELGELAESFRTMAYDLKETRGELLAANEHMENIFSSMSDALFVVSPDGVYQTVNRAACNLLGYEEDEIVGQPFESYFVDGPPIRFPVADDSKVPVAALETRLLTRNNGQVSVNFSSSYMHDKHGEVRGVICLVQDITLRRRSQQEHAWLATIVDKVPEAIVICDAAGKIQYANPAFEQITEYSCDEVIGASADLLKSGKHEQSFYDEIQATLNRGEVWSGHFVNRKKSGALYDEECVISPIRDVDGQVINYISLRRDVTNEKRLERQLVHAQKHEALGTLAGGIAHDFNNILTAILGYTAISMATVDRESKIHKNLEKIIDAGKRAADLVRQILTFTRQTEQEPKPMQLQSVIKESLKLLRGTLPTTIDIKQHISTDCGPILADYTQIHQVIMNLCTNAYHAMRKKGGTLIVSLEEVEVDPKYGPKQPDLASGQYACLSVSDTGHGMDMETLERIFEPYYTTKKSGEGTGLGLATVHGIIESHNGTITVRSQPNQGTTFEVYLPVIPKGMKEKPEEEESERLKVAGRVLFVDDEELIVDMGHELLEQIGCQVTTFTHSLEALEAFRAAPDAFDVIITDQTMPRMTGVELAAEIFEIRPDMPIVLCTGFSEAVDEKRAKALGIREFFMKPLEINRLARVIDGILREDKEESSAS